MTTCLIVIGFAIATLAVALLSSGGLRTLLVAAAPVITLGGAVWALWHTYRTWKAQGRWQIWQGAAWFLLSAFLIVLFNAARFLTS